MQSVHPSTAVRGSRTYGLTVEVRIDVEGPVAASERVTAGDLNDSYAEVWFELLRQGQPDLARDDALVRIEPIYFEDKRPWCAGFKLEAVHASGLHASVVCSRRSLEHVATRAASWLSQAQILGPTDRYYYELRANEEGGSDESDSHGASAGEDDAAPRPRSVPLTHTRMELAPLLAAAGPAQRFDEQGRHHVFYTDEALHKAERISRRGAESTPPVETGGLLVGRLCSCPESGEMFAVIEDVIEAREAEGTTFSLSYSGHTWARVQALMRAKARQPSTAAQRILGQCHGHPFLPLGGAEPCEHCAELEVCTRTSAYLSTDDLAWCRAVFGGQAWQASHVFGLSARSEPVDNFFGQHGGQLELRGFRLIPHQEFQKHLQRALNQD